jgi:uncharacterized membrane protein YfcA
VGAVAGSLILVSVDDRWLSAGLAVVVFSYIGLTVWKGAISLPARVRLKAAVPIGAAGGIVHGATGNSGAVLATYLHSLDLPRSEFVFAATVPFMLLSTVQISTLTLMGRVHEPVLTPALMAMIPVILITPLGTRVGRGLNEHTFSIMVLVLLGIAGLRLVGSVFDM